jgi:HSP20 family molecular chaperone IbpA
VDVISCSEEIAAVAEFSGVNKKDIRLKADDKSLTLELFAGERQFQKRFDLP